MNFVPLLVSLDIHSKPEIETKVPFWIEGSLRLLDSLSAKATFFIPAIFVKPFASSIRMILAEGHEIGCHSLTHGPDEQYNLMPYQRQKAVLYEAKQRIEQVVRREIISFRAPAFKINADTIKALEDNGFSIDSSVNPQRLGILSSELTNVGWMFAPRRPYHPSHNNPFRTGESRLWEIPQSAFIFPFMSNAGMAFGQSFMKLFFRILQIESNFKNNPIVYMFHPEDIDSERDRIRYKFQWRHLLPSKTYGFQIREAIFYHRSPETISKQIINLLNLMCNARNIRCLTFSQMLPLLEDKTDRPG